MKHHISFKHPQQNSKQFYLISRKASCVLVTNKKNKETYKTQIKQPYYKIRVHLIALHTCCIIRCLNLFRSYGWFLLREQWALFSLMQAGSEQQHGVTSRSFMKRP